MLLLTPKPPKLSERPLLRWTVGGCSNLGVEILVYSIRTAMEIFYDFDLAVCYNNLKYNQIEVIKKTGVRMIDQHIYANELAIPPRKCLWALLPLRLHPTGYELFMDNDIVFTSRPPQINEWLKNNSILYSMSSHRCRNYGIFDKFVPKRCYVNTGCFGIPPGFDFKTKVNTIIRKKGKKAKSYRHHNYQGIVAAAIMRHPKKFVLLKRELQLCRSFRTDMKRWTGKYGTHFIRANSTETHEAWETFKKTRLSRYQ